MSGEGYQLRVRVDHMRRTSMSSLLFSLAQQALILERKGEVFEQVHCHLTGDGDYSAIAVVYPVSDEPVPALSGTNGTDMAEDDISAADRIRNQEARDNEEAERLRRIEAARQRDADRFKEAK